MLRRIYAEFAKMTRRICNFLAQNSDVPIVVIFDQQLTMDLIPPSSILTTSTQYAGPMKVKTDASARPPNVTSDSTDFDL